MSAWYYLKSAFWQRVTVPVVGEIPLNAMALAGFGIAGLDHPAFWAAGALWEVGWMTATAGRKGYRGRVDAAARRATWRTIEERRLQLYNQLSGPDQLRHHNLRQACQSLITRSPGAEPDPAVELFTWFHLKLLLARHQIAFGSHPAADPDVPRLHADAAVELTDPARAGLAEEAVTLLDPRQSPIRDPDRPLLPRIDAALSRIEDELAEAVRRNRHGGSLVPFPAMAQSAAGWSGTLDSELPLSAGSLEVDDLLRLMGKREDVLFHDAADITPDGPRL